MPRWASWRRTWAAKAEATARGVSGSLRFLALVTAGFGLVVALARALSPSPPVRPVTR